MANEGALLILAHSIYFKYQYYQIFEKKGIAVKLYVFDLMGYN